MEHATPKDGSRTRRLGPAATDALIRADIEAELRWEPGIDDQQVFVHVLHGVATITGEVASPQARTVVEDVAKRCTGVIAIANEIEVATHSKTTRSDFQIAEALGIALRRHPLMRSAAIAPVVRKGSVMLCGTVRWPFQRTMAISIVQRTAGVRLMACNVSISAWQFGERLRAALSHLEKFLVRAWINTRRPR